MIRKDIFETIVSEATNVAPGNSEPTMTRLNDGRLLLAYTYFYAGKASSESPARISAKISDDGGRTWGKRFPLQETDDGINVTTPSLIRLKSGKLALFYLHKTQRDVCIPYMTKSRDDAETWIESVALTKENLIFDMANDSVIQLSTGRILVPMCCFNRQEGRFSAFTLFSDDNGRTWNKGKNEVKLTKIGAMDPNLVELKNGNVLMTIRNQLGKIFQALSTDRGLTWRNVDFIDLSSSDSPIAIKRIPNTQDIIMAWNSSRDIRRPLTSAISNDEGETWKNIKNIDTGGIYECSHPCITFIDENALIAYNLFGVSTRWISIKLKKIPIKHLYQ